MTAEHATAIAMWACFNYATPHPPEEAARIFCAELDRLGFAVIEKDET